MRPAHTRWVLIVAALLAGLPPAATWAQVTAGPEFRVNTYTTSAQFYSRVAADPAGNFVVAWSNIQGYAPRRVVGQRLDATGTPLGAEFAINQNTIGAHTPGGVAVDGRGNFVVVWTWEPSQFDGEIMGQRFDASGASVGSEFQVNTHTTGNQSSPRVAAAPNGSFVVVWHSLSQDGSDFGVFGRRFDASAAPLGGEFRVNSFTTGSQDTPVVDADSAGGFVVVWSSRYQTGDDSFGVFGQRFTALGAPQGPEFHVNTFTTGIQTEGAVAMDAAGGFIVTWAGDQGQPTTDVFARRFDATGAAVGSEFRVNTYTTDAQTSPRVDSDATGNFVVTWSSYRQDPDPARGVFAQRYDRSAAPRGVEFHVNAYTTSFQLAPEVASDPVGNFVVTWASYGQDGDSFGIFGQRFGGLLPAALSVDAAAGPASNGNGVLEGGETVGVAPSWRNVNGAPQTFTGAASAFTGPGTSGNPTYTIVDGAASYGTVPNGGTASCAGAADCYAVGLTVPSARPVTHWDAALREDILPAVQGQSKPWALHVGDSFADVPRANPFYRFVETLLHRGVTSGCTATQYCPTNATSREQMAVFVLVGREGAGYLPPACGASPLFTDVPVSSPFCRWIEELARRGVVGGCGPGFYCPASPVSREQMAVFVLRTLDPTLNPPACAPPNIYADVPETSPFCPWIEELTRRAVVSGCGGGNYCPANLVSREQMGVFIGVTFALTLYGV